MRLVAFQVERFRSIIDQVSVEVPADFLALSGPNNSGKSNLLRALNLLLNDETEPGEAYSWQRDFPIPLQHPEYLADAKSGDRETVAEATFELRPEDDRRFIERVESSRGLEDQLGTSTVRFLSRFGERGRLNFIIGVRRTPLTGDLADWFFQALRRKIAYVYLPAQKDMRALIGRDVLPAINEVTRDAWAAGPDFARLKDQFQEAASIQAEIYEAMMESPAQSIQADLNLLDEALTASFTARGTDDPIIPLFLVDDGVSTDLLRQGAGTQNRVIVFLLDYIAYRLSVTSRNDKTQTIFALEEPESFVHPGAQRKLAAALRAIASKHQMLITTHSVNLLDPHQPSANVLLHRSLDEDPIMTRIIDTGVGNELRPFRELLGDWAIAPDIDSRYVVLIEGKHDFKYISAVAAELDRRQKSPLRPSARLHRAGGFGDLKKLAVFAELSGLRFVILAERDSEEKLRPKFEAEGWQEGKHFVLVGKEGPGFRGSIEDLMPADARRDYLAAVNNFQLELSMRNYAGQVLSGDENRPPLDPGRIKDAFCDLVVEHVRDYDFPDVSNLLHAVEAAFQAQDTE